MIDLIFLFYHFEEQNQNDDSEFRGCTLDILLFASCFSYVCVLQYLLTYMTMCTQLKNEED